MIYSAAGPPFTVDAGRLSGSTLTVHWYEPRSGTAHAAPSVAGASTHTVSPPTHGAGQDWVLVLYDARRGFPPPGVVEPA